MELTSDSLCRWLVEAQLVESHQLDHIVSTTQSVLTLTASLLERELVTEVDLVELISRNIEVPAAPRRLYKLSVAHKVLQTIPEDLCWQHHLFPFGIDRTAGRLQVAMTDPTDVEAVEALTKLVGHEPQIFVVGPRSLDKAIRKHYLDSWIDETDGKRRRFFGYEDITDPRAQVHRSALDEKMPPVAPQRGPAVRHVDAPPPEPVEEMAREAARRAPTPLRGDDSTDEIQTVKRVPARGYAFDNVRPTSETQTVADGGEVEQPSRSDDADAAARAKRDLDDNITGPLPSRRELAATARAGAEKQKQRQRQKQKRQGRVAVARIVPDDRATLMSQRVRALERAVASLIKLLASSSDPHIAEQAGELLDRLRDELG